MKLHLYPSTHSSASPSSVVPSRRLRTTARSRSPSSCSSIIIGLNLLTSSFLIHSSFAAVPNTCQICGCDDCTGDQYNEIGNPGGIIPVPPKLQSGALADVTELHCFWLPFTEIFLGGLNFCTDDALRLQREFRETCGCADPPSGVEMIPGSLEDFLDELVDNPACNVCGSDPSIRLQTDFFATFTVPSDKLGIFPTSVMDKATFNDDGSAVIFCNEVDKAGTHHHFPEATCSAISELPEFQDGCECQKVDDDAGSCDLCGCDDCPPHLFQMTNPNGAIPIPEELHGSLNGLSEVHCWLVDYAIQQGEQGAAELPDDYCRTFQQSELFREACGCPPLPTKDDLAEGDATMDDTEATMDDTEATMDDAELKAADEEESSTRSSAGAAVAVVFGLLAGGLIAFVLVRRKKQPRANPNEIMPNGPTFDDITDSSITHSDEKTII